ncbi:hypothetical protein WLU71_23355, partial [Bordetella bronchiseptica]
MTTISCIYVRLPNWIGDVCMSLPSLRTLQDSGAPLVVCARPWARDLLAGVPKQDFLPMTGKVLRDRATVAAHRRALGGVRVEWFKDEATGQMKMREVEDSEF